MAREKLARAFDFPHLGVYVLAQWHGKNSPLGQTLEVVAARALVLKGSDAEPRGLLVLAAARVGRDGVLEDLAAVGGRGQLRGPGQVADDGQLGDGARGRAAEGTGGEARGGHGGAAGDERHFFWRLASVVGGGWSGEER